MTEIVRKETEIETVNHIDNSKRESNSKHIPHKIPVDIPVKVNLFHDEVKTHQKGGETTNNERNEYKNNSIKIFSSNG